MDDEDLYQLLAYDGVRLLGFDNAHGIPRARAFDHRHRFRQTDQLEPFAFQDGYHLLASFFSAVKAACAQEGVEPQFVERTKMLPDEYEEAEHEDQADDR